MKYLWITLAAIAVLIALTAIVGALLPVAHQAARKLTLRQPPAAIWAALTDLDAMTTWRTELKSLTRLPDREGHRCYREESSFGPIDLCVEHEERERLLVTRIVTANSPFGGTWTFRLTPHGDTTDVQITENGEVHNVLFRALGRFVFGQSKTIEGYLRALAGRFGEPASIAPAVPDPPPVAGPGEAR